MSKDSIEDIRKLSQFLDSHFRLPFGWKIGWDGLIGLIPGFGDFMTNILSLYILIRGAFLGCSVPVLLRMGFNILIDNVVDFVPLLGGFFDFMWKSNQKNLQLIEKHLDSPPAARRESVWVLAGVCAVLVILFLLLLTFSIQFALFVLQQIQLLIHQTQW